MLCLGGKEQFRSAARRVVKNANAIQALMAFVVVDAACYSVASKFPRM
jgi:hypothetical protein